MQGVLRRPQMTEDALPAPLNPGDPSRFGEGIYVKYVRLARVVAKVKYYIVPVAKGRVLDAACVKGYTSRPWEPLARCPVT